VLLIIADRRDVRLCRSWHVHPDRESHVLAPGLYSPSSWTLPSGSMRVRCTGGTGINGSLPPVSLHVLVYQCPWMVIVPPGLTVGTGPWNGPLGGWSFTYGPTQEALEVPFASDVAVVLESPVGFDGPPRAAQRSSSPDAPSRRIRGRTFTMCVRRMASRRGSSGPPIMSALDRSSASVPSSEMRHVSA
jgi:hypothetical protein